MNVWTIGHWTCPEGVFLERLDRHDIQTVVDVRSFPGSRKSPQYGAEAMRGWLDNAGIRYVHLVKLGGRRKAQHLDDPDLNSGWQNASFRNYADYTTTSDFTEGLAELEQIASGSRTAYLCGEPMPWRCHRLLISNVLTAKGWRVRHIMTDRTVEHELGKWGAAPEIHAGQVTYPGQLSLAS